MQSGWLGSSFSGNGTSADDNLVLFPFPLSSLGERLTIACDWPLLSLRNIVCIYHTSYNEMSIVTSQHTPKARVNERITISLFQSLRCTICGYMNSHGGGVYGRNIVILYNIYESNCHLHHVIIIVIIIIIINNDFAFLQPPTVCPFNYFSCDLQETSQDISLTWPFS